MSNTSEHAAGTCLVPANQEDRRSLWHVAATVPPGRHQVSGPSSTGICREYVGTHWTDMRPASLAKASGACLPYGEVMST